MFHKPLVFIHDIFLTLSPPWYGVCLFICLFVYFVSGVILYVCLNLNIITTQLQTNPSLNSCKVLGILTKDHYWQFFT